MGRHISASQRVQSEEEPQKTDTTGKTEETSLFLFLKNLKLTSNDCVSFHSTLLVLFLIQCEPFWSF